MHSATPLARWLKKTGSTVSGTARALNISRPRLYHYINGYAAPTGDVLDALVKLTGLRPAAFQKPRRDAA